jgi:hypothetical protein
MRKHLLRADAVRRVPKQFSWLDQRLVRERYIERCDADALALYLVLVTVGDEQGLSYYGTAALCRCVSMNESRLHQARQGLLAAGLIAYQAPLYQVLSLDRPVGDIEQRAVSGAEVARSADAARSARVALLQSSLAELLRVPSSTSGSGA